MDPADTIVAIASPPGAALRGIVRLSGANAAALLAPLLAARLPESRRALATDLALGAPWPPIPVRVLWMPGPRSYTGEDSAELHLSGARPVLAAVLEALLARGARQAEPGEFTLRAFLAGKLDLTQAEAVQQLVAAPDARAAAAGLANLTGGLSERLAPTYERVRALVTQAELDLDFSDADVPVLSAQALAMEADALAGAIDDLLARGHTMAAAADEPRIVLAGPPNAGKSSWFNVCATATADAAEAPAEAVATDAPAADEVAAASARQPPAIVTARPHTTRDVLTALVGERRAALLVVDTAGLTTAAALAGASAPLDARAMRRTERVLAAAAVVCWCFPADGPAPLGPLAPSAAPAVVVMTKADLEPAWSLADAEARFGAAASVSTSARSGAGRAAFFAAVHQALGMAPAASAPPAAYALNARAHAALTTARDRLREAAGVAHAGHPPELAAQSLKESAEALGSVLGADLTEEVLTAIFAGFCIGK